MGMGRGKVPNGVPQHNHRSTGIQFRDGVTQHNHRNTGIQFRDGVPQHNHRNTGSHFRGRGAKNPLVTKRFSEDFDFEAMNEKFNKKEVWDFLGRSNKDEPDEGIGDEKEMGESDAEDTTGDRSAKHDNKPVYCKEDFFDSLSCHALDRESGKVKFSDQRKKDVETKTEIVVTQGDQDGGKIGAMVREIGASTLVAGLHDHSFLYRLAMSHNHIGSNLNCKVVAIKQPTPLMTKGTRTRTICFQDSSTNMDFSQIEINALSFPEVTPPKVPYQICPDRHSIIWRSGRSRRSMVKKKVNSE